MFEFLKVSQRRKARRVYKIAENLHSLEGIWRIWIILLCYSWKKLNPNTNGVFLGKNFNIFKFPIFTSKQFRPLIGNILSLHVSLLSCCLFLLSFQTSKFENINIPPLPCSIRVKLQDCQVFVITARPNSTLFIENVLVLMLCSPWLGFHLLPCQVY